MDSRERGRERRGRERGRSTLGCQFGYKRSPLFDLKHAFWGSKLPL